MHDDEDQRRDDGPDHPDAGCAVDGRKDRNVFARSFFVWTDKELLPDDLEGPETPVFIAADDGLHRVDDSPRSTDVTSREVLPYRGAISAR